MKHFLLVSVLLAISSTAAYSQLKVTSAGKVGIGITQTPISNFAVGDSGEQYVRSKFKGDIVAVKIHGLGNSPYESNYWGTSLMIKNEISSFRGDMGIDCRVCASTPLGRGKAVGIASSAGNATKGYNYGIIGNLEGSNDGAGVFGSVNHSQGVIIDGLYAGYFSGNVKVTGTINGVVVGNSDIRYKQNIKKISNSSDDILNKINKLNPISYNLKQIYTASLLKSNSKDTTSVEEQKAYDENSEMYQKEHFGLIAQDLQKIYPNLVYEDNNGYLSVNYIEMIPLLIQSIKELKEEVEQLSSSSSTTFSVLAQSSKQIPSYQLRSDSIAGISSAVLYQNSPNPFKENTKIGFKLPEDIRSASICIFNMTGAMLKQISIETGQTSITINGSEFTAGMYLYSLIINGNEVDTKRMILTK